MNTVYWLISAVMLMVFSCHMGLILRQIANVNKKVGKLKVVYKPKGFTNCSFLNYVFVGEQDLTDDGIGVILQHEAVHANRLHSLDKLFVNICKVILWFNPLIYLYGHALEQVHEYEADQEASSLIGSTSYANFLLSIAVLKNNPSLVHSFVKNPLKARIKMLFTNPSKNMKKLTYLIAFPLLSILLWSFSVAYIDKPLTKKSSEEITDKAQATNLKDSVKYRQKVKRTPEMLKADAADEIWYKTGEFEIKGKFARSMMGKKIEVLVKDEVEVDFGPRMIFKLLVEYDNKDYYLECDLPTGAEKIKGLAKTGDKLEVLVSSVGYSRNPIMSIEAEKIVKDGHLIYEMKRPKAIPNEKPAPFLFEVNKVRFNYGVITKAGSVVAGKRNVEVSANGYKFLLRINSKQVALSELASFKLGDKVSLRFVHEVKTGTLAYTIADWVSISKNVKDYGVKNKQMFYRFYEEVPVDEKVMRTNSSLQQESFVKTTVKKYSDYVQYIYEAKSPNGKKMTMIVGLSSAKPKFFIHQKLYSYEDAEKFDRTFLSELSSNQGGGPASYYDLDGLNEKDMVFWFGVEPKLNINERKNRDAYAKYQGKTLKAKVIDYSYSPVTKKLMDGFYIKTEEGVNMKVFIEAKYAKQINAKLKSGDLLTIIVKNIGYWKNENSIVIQSSKLIKDGATLFDRNRPVMEERTGAIKQPEIYVSLK